ncbi:MAG TPA: 50S ribosomal protein L25/general stress protein Ctc [Dongiaceae bacterium]|jgi:large subunit ribosomal protein L25|nr:50S ribosomal protein L25/general stress protein Ctc [Dongiaceae bacterium]
MSTIQSISAVSRSRAGKGAARETRRNGHVPAVIYGEKKEPTLIAIDPKALGKLIQRKSFYTNLLDIDIAGTKYRVLPRDVQLDPVTDRPLHADFQRVSKDSRIHVSVPVVIRNESASPGIKRGGVVNIVRHEIDFICSPESIPHEIVVDLTGMEIGDSVHIGSIGLPENVTPTIRERDFTIVTIGAPTTLKAEEDKPAAAATATAAAPAGGAAPAAQPAAGAKPAEKKK